MPTKTRADYIEEPRELGETAPAKWTITEMKIRISELREEKGMNTKKKGQTELQVWVVRLNKASRKKSELQRFIQEELQSPVNDSDTIVQLQKQALEKIYMVSQTCGEDPVGFGVHSALTYEEVLERYPQYAQWVVQTSEEGECSSRLRRLATWIQHQQNPKGTAKSKAAASKPVTPMIAKKELEEQPGTPEVMTVMMTIMNQMKEIKEEMDDLRGRPHKKTNKDEEMSSKQSWAPVNEP